MLSPLSMIGVTFTDSHFTLGIRPKHLRIWGCLMVVWERRRALSRKGMPCLFGFFMKKKMWSLEKWWKTELYSPNSSIWGTVKHTDVCCDCLASLKWSSLLIHPKTLGIFPKSKMASCLVEIFKCVCALPHGHLGPEGCCMPSLKIVQWLPLA